MTHTETAAEQHGNGQCYCVIRTDGTNKDFIELCRQLDANLDELVGTKFQRSQYAQYNTLEQIHNVVLLYDGERAIGGGGFKKYDGERAELKRVFVHPDYRGQKIGRKLVTEICNWASESGFRRMILETGTPLAAAHALYEKMGFVRIPNYGQYRDMVNSLCMEKKLCRQEDILEERKITYRQADISDSSELLRLRLAYIAEDCKMDTAAIPEQIKTSLPVYFSEHLGKDAFVFTAEAEKRLVATAILVIIERPANPFFKTGKTGEVLNVYTEPEFRKKGIASRLIQSLLDFSKETGLDFVELKATEEGFPLYKKLGFTEAHRPYTTMTYELA